MARPREFSVDEALESAMQLFWTGGYHATSTREIEKHLGLGRQSVYNAFGDKESLYHAALRRYVDTVLVTRVADLRQSSAGRREVVRFLAGLVEFLDGDPARRGCFLVNAVAECAATDPAVAEVATTYSNDCATLLERAIAAGIQSGEIPSGTNSHAVAKMLQATEAGMSVAARTRAERKHLVDIASAALQPLY